MTNNDLELLQQGYPPISDEVIEYLTVNNEWLTYMNEYCLPQVINQGGCKVKILYGETATGKSHFLQTIRIRAKNNGFFVVYLDMQELEFHITDIASLYRAISCKVDMQELKDKLMEKLIKRLGYQLSEWISFNGSVYDFVCEREESPIFVADKTIRKCINDIVNNLDISFSFRIFLVRFMEALSDNNEDLIELITKWFMGEKLSYTEKKQSQLFEPLKKQNARVWLFSLIEIIKLSGYSGVVLLFDHFEAIFPHSNCSVSYTNLKRNDVYEMLRQVIDDLDFLKNFLMIIAGNTKIVTDEKYGFESYHALWMRIQQSFKQEQIINPYSDMIDANLVLASLKNSGILIDLTARIDRLIDNGIPNVSKHSAAIDLSHQDFRSVVMNHSLRYKLEV